MHTHRLVRAFASRLNISICDRLLTEHHLEFLSLKGGCKGSSESTFVKMPHCWKSHVINCFILQVIVLGDSKGCYSFESVLASEGTPYIVPPTDCRKSTSTLMYSSGTTGFPKAVKHSHFTITANTVLIRLVWHVLSCQTRVTGTTCFVYNC